MRYGRTPIPMTLSLIFDLAAHLDVLTSSKIYVTYTSMLVWCPVFPLKAAVHLSHRSLSVSGKRKKRRPASLPILLLHPTTQQALTITVQENPHDPDKHGPAEPKRPCPPVGGHFRMVRLRVVYV